MSQTDGDLVRLCLNGHPEMFRQLVVRYQAPLLNHLTGRLGDYDAAVEAAQETMVRAYFALPTLKRAESFAAWLFGIADRVGREMCRAARRQAESLQRKPAAPGAENGTSRVELADASLRQAVNDLPEPYREVVLRRFYGGQSCAEIGSSLRVSLGTITSRLSRAYLLLRKALRECEDEGEHRS